MLISYAATIFFGSFLLFQVQPMLGKQLIPLFGGSSAVWTVCILFFQTVLIIGYGYAHALTCLNKRKQAVIHLCLLGAGFLFLHLDYAGNMSVIAPDSPTWSILRLLLVSAGFPLVLLSSSAPLLQHWFVAGGQGKAHWKLYAFSNTGSLLALLSYPIVLEPLLDVGKQARLWSWGYVVYMVLFGFCLLRPLLQGKISSETSLGETAEQKAEEGTVFSMADLFLWLACSACGSAVLVAVTNQISQQVAVVPFVWVVPLACYLVTFIICFSVRSATSRRVGAFFLVTSFVLTILSLTAGNGFTLPVQLLLFTGSLTSCCMVCHGYLVRLRPQPASLTLYYLMLAVGGAAGSAFISLVAPRLFTSFVELPFLVAAVCVIYVIRAWRDRTPLTRPWLLWLAVALFCVQMAFSLFYARVLNKGVVESRRNFYGTLKVIEGVDTLGRKLMIKHGFITHGSQYQDSSLQKTGTTYYGADSAAGLAIRLHPRRASEAAGVEKQRLKVGLVGLGAGTLATYGEAGDLFRFYEIDSDGIYMAQKYFSFLRDSKARIEIVTGDARQSLQKEARQVGRERYDILVIDAFNSDNVPVHLVTREAIALYLSLLQADGILLFHISSRNVDLMPVLATHAATYGTAVVNIYTPENPAIGSGSSSWAILTNNRGFLENPEVKKGLTAYSARKVEWTDRFSSVWDVLN